MRVRHYIFIVLAVVAAPITLGAVFAITFSRAVVVEATKAQINASALEPAVAPLPELPSLPGGALPAAAKKRLEIDPKIGEPITNALARVTKKPFGIEIWPGHSPVENDRFSGFHVGVDFETFPYEQDLNVAISAVCDGPLLFKKFGHGYGGVAVQKCNLDDREVSLIYGHLRLESILPEPGQLLSRGQYIGDLGRGNSEETDGVRKHLHLGIRVGTGDDIRGYVKDSAEMIEFIDPLQYMTR